MNYNTDFPPLDYSNLPRYDVNSTDNKLLQELYTLANEQNERLEWFFLEIRTDPLHNWRKEAFIKPRQHRLSAAKRRSSIERQREEKEADERGYKNFLKEEGLTDLL